MMTLWCRSCGSVTNDEDRKCDCTDFKTGTQSLIPYDLTACEMCGCGIADDDRGFWHQTAPVDRWLCEPCFDREGKAIQRGQKIQGTHYAA